MDGRAIPLGNYLTASRSLPLGPTFTRNPLHHEGLTPGPGRERRCGAHCRARPVAGRERSDDDVRRRSFVVKRYRSARGFKRLLYEYTRGGGINGVAPLSCRRRRCVFARRIISVVVVTWGVEAGASSTVHGQRDDSTEPPSRTSVNNIYYYCYTRT